MMVVQESEVGRLNVWGNIRAGLPNWEGSAVVAHDDGRMTSGGSAQKRGERKAEEPGGTSREGKVYIHWRRPASIR